MNDHETATDKIFGGFASIGDSDDARIQFGNDGCVVGKDSKASSNRGDVDAVHKGIVEQDLVRKSKSECKLSFGDGGGGGGCGSLGVASVKERLDVSGDRGREDAQHFLSFFFFLFYQLILLLDHKKRRNDKEKSLERRERF